MSIQIIQLGLNTSDLPATLLLYSQVFGFQNGGGQILAGEVIRIQGLDQDSHALMWWLVGPQPMFQLEFFHHTRPAQRTLRADWTPADHGWTRFGIAIDDFDAALDALAKRDIPIIAKVMKVNGKRRAAFRDPFIGVIVEIMEDGPELQTLHGADALPAIVYAAASVSDLDAARTYYGDVIGLDIQPAERLHDAASEALWGLPNAERTGFVALGHRIAIEISCYASPVGRPRPADYRASDQGMVNVAFGAADKASVAPVLDRLAAAGHVPPFRLENDLILAGYIIDAEREIEIATVPTELAAMLGWLPAAPFLASL